MTNEALERLVLSSIPLMSLTRIYMPDDAASGCLVDVGHKRVLLTVSHATGNMANWSMAMHFDAPTRRMGQYQLGSMSFLSAVSVGKRKVKSRSVDFSYKILPEAVQPMHENISPEGVILSSVPKIILSPPILPNPETEFGFFGLTYSDLTDKFEWKSVAMLQDGLKLCGEDEDLFWFKTPEKYFCHKEYKGCSGAPILDEHGNLVALVVEGDEKKTMIKGLKLRKYWAAIEIEAGFFD